MLKASCTVAFQGSPPSSTRTDTWFDPGIGNAGRRRKESPEPTVELPQNATLKWSTTCWLMPFLNVNSFCRQLGEQERVSSGHEAVYFVNTVCCKAGLLQIVASDLAGRN